MIRTMSIPLFLATPILVLWPPKSIPTTLIVNGDMYGKSTEKGEKKGGQKEKKDGGKRVVRKEKGKKGWEKEKEGRLFCTRATERGGGSAAVASEGLAPSAVSSVFTVVLVVVEV